MHRTLPTRLLLAATLSFSLATGATPVYTPARIVEGDQSIQALLAVPGALLAGDYVATCKTLVLKSGRARAFRCRSETELPHNLLRSIERAGNKAVLEPATRDGEPVEARMSLTVRIQATADASARIQVEPNNGVEAGKFGPHYTAPQRMTRIYWPRSWSPPAAYIKDDPFTLLAVLHVDDSGNVTAAELLNESRSADRQAVASFRRQLDGLKFVPGFVDGRPTAMMHIEPLLQQDEHQLETMVR